MWEDGEGSFGFYSARSVYMIRTFQANREILEDYREGARIDEVECSLITEHRHKTRRFRYDSTIYYTQISGIRNVVRELQLTSPWRRHPEKLKRIESLKETLEAQGNHGQKKMREALEVLETL